VTVINPIHFIPIIKSDNKLITQVLFNLLNNAVKYNKEAGTIKIESSIIDSKANESNKIKVSITDTGKGIAAKNLQKLFNPFERIEAENSGIEGTGLGLSVVEKLMIVLEGNIGVESELGVGSTFWITLPIKSNDDFQKEQIGHQNEQISEMKSELNAYEKDKISRADELAIANIELDYQQQEKANRADELVLANIELDYQQKEKADRADELVILQNEIVQNKLEKELLSKKGLVLCIDDNQKNTELVKQVINLKRPNIEVVNSLT
jgi:hypothetical protein